MSRGAPNTRKPYCEFCGRIGTGAISQSTGKHFRCGGNVNYKTVGDFRMSDEKRICLTCGGSGVIKREGSTKGERCPDCQSGVVAPKPGQHEFMSSAAAVALEAAARHVPLITSESSRVLTLEVAAKGEHMEKLTVEDIPALVERIAELESERDALVAADECVYLLFQRATSCRTCRLSLGLNRSRPDFRRFKEIVRQEIERSPQPAATGTGEQQLCGEKRLDSGAPR